MTHGLYGMWYMETQLFLVPSIKECPVEYSQAFCRSGLTTEVKEFLKCLEIWARFSDLVLGSISRDSQIFPHGLTGSFERLLERHQTLKQHKDGEKGKQTDISWGPAMARPFP